MNEYLVVLTVLFFFVLRFVAPVALLILIGHVASRLENHFSFPARS